MKMFCTKLRLLKIIRDQIPQEIIFTHIFTTAIIEFNDCQIAMLSIKEDMEVQEI